MKKRKQKSFVEACLNTHRIWEINPTTRVMENKKKNKKIIRREGMKSIRDYIPSFYLNINFT